MADIVFRELTGNNLPHVLIVRNQNELIDQSISQFGNTAAYFGTGLIMDKALDQIPKLLKQPITAQTKPWFIFGKSLSIFSLIASVNYAMPFLRNYITTKRTGTTHYADMIGEKKHLNTTQTNINEKLAEDKKTFLHRVSLGAGISALSTLATTALMRAKAPVPKAVSFFNKHLGLLNGSFKKFRALPAVLFWVIPTYSGLLSGARDKYETQELALRFAAFNLAFFVFPHTIEKAIEKATERVKPTKLLGPETNKNLAYLGKFASSIVFCSAIPTVLNIYLTRQRIKRDQAAKIREQKPEQQTRLTLRQQHFSAFTNALNNYPSIQPHSRLAVTEQNPFYPLNTPLRQPSLPYYWQPAQVHS